MARRPRKGRRITRLSATLIAERRSDVQRLHLYGYGPAAILKAITKDKPDLLKDQTDAYEVIRDDLRVVEEQQVAELEAGVGLLTLAGWINFNKQILREAMVDHQNAPKDSLAKNRHLQTAMEAAKNIYRAHGLPVDAPAFNLNINALFADAGIDLPALAGAGTPAGLLPAGGAVGGKVDALTFATDPRFCGLGTITEGFPMQERVLREFMAPSSHYRTLILVCGMRSGKGVLGSVIAWYAAYELLSLDDPQAYFGLAPGQEIQIVNIATNQLQAKNNVFKHIKDRLETGGPWFQALRDSVNETGLELRLPKNIVLRCGHSRASGQVGATSYVVIMDELSRFRDTEGRDNAEDVYNKMGATTATFQDSARVLVLTSPEWEGDMAMRLLELAVEEDKEGQAVRPSMLGLQLATWECNNNLTRHYLWETFDGEGNPTAFWRDFGARPPLVAEGYYPDPERWDRQADPERRHPYDKAGRLEPWFKPCCDSKRFVHIDLGVTRDACGLAMAHKPVPGCPYYKTIIAGDKQVENPNAKTIVLDVALQIRPPRVREQRGEISFERVRQYIRDWSDRGFPVKGGLVSYDGWQSLDSRQLLRKEGFRTTEYSLDRNTEGHDTLQELINKDGLSYYQHDVLIAEAKRLQLLRGKKVDHPKGGSKDVVDAVAGAVYQALRRGGRTRFVG